MTAPTESPAPTAARRGGQVERRTVVLSAVVLFGALLIGIGAIAVFSDPGNDAAPTATNSGSPHIIDRPNSGSEPTYPGDRGGSEQLLVLAGMVIAITGIAFIALRGGSKARANRARWKTAGETGRDGVLDE